MLPFYYSGVKERDSPWVFKNRFNNRKKEKAKSRPFRPGFFGYNALFILKKDNH